MKIIQINTDVNSGSTGRITEDIGRVLISIKSESLVAFGRGNRPSDSRLIKIGSKWDVLCHGLMTALFDKHGFGSKRATRKLIHEIDRENPDAIGLHNLHGYYINIEILFDYIKKKNIPVLWTLFDCWAFTGHCSYFDSINCEKWIKQCNNCPKYNKYPASYCQDNSFSNYNRKKELFNNVPNLNIVVHSEWLKSLVERSFLADYYVHKIHSGIDIERFSPKNNLEFVRNKFELGHKKIVLGVASVWDERKGLQDFSKLFLQLEDHILIVLVGLTPKQIEKLPNKMIGISRTEDVQELASLYSIADVFVNPTTQDNFPTTNLEALACGTPVITYNTGGSPEAIDEETGIVVEKGNVEELRIAINKILKEGKQKYSFSCRKRAVELYNKDDRYKDYIKIYENLISQAKH